MPSDNAPRIGVIGCGHWGKNLVRNFRQLGGLAAICDGDAEALERVGSENPDAARFTDADALLADTAIPAVAIATPAATHGGMVRRALEAGKHVFVEKPLCLDLDEGEALRRQAEEAERILMVGHLLRYHPAFIALRNLVDSGDIGALRYIVSNRLSLGKVRNEENALWSFAPHDISMILALVGSMPEVVSVNGGSYLKPGIADVTLSHLKFSDNVQAHTFVSWLHPFKDQELVVIGERAMIVMDDTRSGDDKLLIYRHSVSWTGDIPTIDRVPADPVTYEDVEPLQNECQHFIDCLTTGRQPITDAAEGLRVLRVLSACQDSLDKGGQPIELD